MWLATTMACVCAVGYQIYERVSFYRSWPVNVNFELIYNKSLRFPAVTICNQNSFRATKAAEFGLYDLIEDVFSKSAVSPLEDIKRYNASNITMEDLFVKLGHDKHDLFVSCRWKNKKCTPDDFIPVLTDHGLCYTFFPNSSEMVVSTPGIDSGLQLMLNIEQYEYMNGPHDSAGVKVLLHDPRQTPLVASLGQAVSTGSSTFVGIKLQMIEYQSPPYGDCSSKPLNHTAFYTTEECFLDCMSEVVTEECGCKDVYTRADNDTMIKTCNLEQYFSCIREAKDKFYEMYEHRCQCPLSCKVAIFDPAFSDGSLSDHAVNSLLSSNLSRSLYKKLQEASETKAKMDKLNQEAFRILFNRLKSVYTLFKSNLHLLSERLKQTIDNVNDMWSDVKHVHAFLDWKCNCQLYAFYIGILQDKDIVSNDVSESANAFSNMWLHRLQRLLNASAIQDTGVSNRGHIYEQTIVELQNKKYYIRNAQVDGSLLLQCFSNGVLNSDILLMDLNPRLNQSYIALFVPRLAMKEAILNFSYLYTRPMSDRIMYCIEEFYNLYSNVNTVIDELIELTETAWHNPDNDSVYEMSINAVLNYVNANLESNSCRDILNRMIFRYPILKIERNKESLIRNRDRYEQVFDKRKSILLLIEFKVKIISSLMNMEFENLFIITNAYLDFKLHSMTEINSELLSENIVSAMTNLKHFSFELETRLNMFSQHTMTALSALDDAWWQELKEVDGAEVDAYGHLHISYVHLPPIKNFTFVRYLRSLLIDIEKLSLSVCMGDKDKDFYNVFDTFTHYLDTFNRSVIIDSNFLKKNFLNLNIFYRQLSYEYIQQQKAYDIFSLICDIGGSMGLFIGASMLTVVEVIDLLLGQTPLFRKKTKLKENFSQTNEAVAN